MKTDKSYLIEVLKGRYEYEQFRRNNYDNIISLPITLLALLIGGMAAIVMHGTLTDYLVRYSILIAMIPAGISTYYLVRVYYGSNRNYDVLPEAKSIREHYEELTKYHEKLSDSSDQVHLSFQEDLINWYCECSKINGIVNDQRMEYFHKSKMWLIVSIVLIFVLLCIKVIFNL